MKKSYITEAEKEKCRQVADAFAELYELENILVMDAGRYGFVKLQYYTENQGFDNVYTFTDCRSLFEDLWVEWLDTKLYLMAKGTPLLEKGYKGIFESLPEEKKKELIKKIDQLKPIDLLMIQNVADVLITRDKIETSKKQLVQQ